MKDLKPIRGRKYILEQIALGEHQQQDFKYAISDARKIARSISAFANRNGGQLLVGVKDNGTIAGVRNEEDIYVIEQAAQLYCDPPQDVEFTAFSTGDTGIVIRARIAKAENPPVRAQEPDLSWKAYYRVADENISAHPLMVRAWMSRNSSMGCMLTLDGVEHTLLDVLGEKGPIPIEYVFISACASRRTLEQAIVKLAAAGIIEFVHRPNLGFCLDISTP